jgi:hypothetical protein
MAGTWEIRGLFGNELAMENAIDELKKHKKLEWAVLDRRNLSVRLARRDPEAEAIAKRALQMNHGFVESEAPLGRYDAKVEAKRRDKEKKEEKKHRERLDSAKKAQAVKLL